MPDFPTVTRVAFPALVRTVHIPSSAIINPGKSGIRFDIDITAFTGTSITFTVESWDPAKQGWVTELASAALAATGRTTIQVDPRIAAAANLVAQRIVPKQLRITPSGTITSVTYSVVYTFG
jgi:hypothetical protein